MSLVALLLALAAPPAHAAPGDFDGTWVLDLSASDSMDPLLKAQGVSAMKRMAAAALVVTQRITASASSVRLVVESKANNTDNTIAMDGSAHTEKGPAGDIVARDRWVGNAWVTDSEMSGGAACPCKLTLTRTLEGDVLKQRFALTTNDGASHVMNRVFRRAP